MISLLRLINMRPQLPLLLSQRRLLLTFDRTTGDDHHNWLIPRLLLVRRTARLILLLLALQRTELLSSFTTLLDRRDTFSVVCLGFLFGSQDVHFRDESVFVAGLGKGLFLSLESGEFAFGPGSAALFDGFGDGFEFQVVEHGKVGRC